MKTRYVLAALALALVLSACGGISSAPPDALTLPDLGGVETLQAQFSEDSGTPRLILLLSPT